MTKKKPENVGKKQDTKFKPGQSGNPAGKPKGARHKATMLAEQLLDSEVEELVKHCIAMAKGGDSTAMKLVMDRLVPPRKERPVSISLPKIEKLEDAATALETITQAISDKDITPGEGQVLSYMIENYRRTVETVELEKRIENLEKEKDGNGRNR